MPDPFHVRLGHLVPDGPPVDFLVDGYPVLSDRPFGSLNDYTEHAPDEYDLGVAEHGEGEPFVAEPVAFEAGGYYTVLLVGTMDSATLLVLEDGA